MVHLSPLSAAAVITSAKPTAWNCASPATKRPSPTDMTDTTAARLQLGLHGEEGRASVGLAGGHVGVELRVHVQIVGVHDHLCSSTLIPTTPAPAP
jgi:hypothetical protein